MTTTKKMWANWHQILHLYHHFRGEEEVCQIFPVFLLKIFVEDLNFEDNSLQETR